VQIGFGIAISVLLDATVVRSCVVPTVLILAGEKVVWWSPAWLRVGRPLD
jgi:RND superfamily putative drug exporter